MASPTSSIKGAVKIDYTPNIVDIPASFLTSPPAIEPTCHSIDFTESNLPEFEGRVAFTIDDVLSREECEELIELAESSVRRKDESESAWRPALIAIGNGWEITSPGYRVSDRIVWDQQEVADRIWERCLQADGVRERMSEELRQANSRWRLHSLNERLRFLKYSENQYFRPHCDSSTWLDKDGKECRTFYTLHLYLNDSAACSPTGEGVVGGATSFLSFNGKRRLDVNPKAGSVLIFTHEGLRHEGAEVTQGVKYTVRSDVFYARM